MLYFSSNRSAASVVPAFLYNFHLASSIHTRYHNIFSIPFGLPYHPWLFSSYSNFTGILISWKTFIAFVLLMRAHIIFSLMSFSISSSFKYLIHFIFLIEIPFSLQSISVSSLPSSTLAYKPFSTRFSTRSSVKNYTSQSSFFAFLSAADIWKGTTSPKLESKNILSAMPSSITRVFDPRYPLTLVIL